MRALDLFSGIGGFALGFERAGIETLAFCEADSYCQSVLRRHWPEVPIYDDVREVTEDSLFTDGIMRPNIICGGFPCQPYSRAGHRRGASDPRDMLPEFLRIVHEFKPTWVIGENTSGFGDSGLDAMCDDLEDTGYSVQTFDIPSCSCGLPTMERHLWIIATPSSERLERLRQVALQTIENGTQEFQGSDPRGAERWYLPASRVCGVGERIPGRVDRLRALGNAVSPQVTRVIGHAVLEAHR